MTLDGKCESAREILGKSLKFFKQRLHEQNHTMMFPSSSACPGPFDKVQ